MERNGEAGQGTPASVANAAGSSVLARQRQLAGPGGTTSVGDGDSLDVPLTSLSSVPTSSWDSESEGHTHNPSEVKEDRRKFIELTTPTLIEETYGEDEEEMVELSQNQHQHQHQRESSQFDHDTQPRLTDALRRTPGATQMHLSNRDMLGYGLTLSTPLAARSQRENQNYTPAGWTLSKNPHLENVSHGAFSPNTLRLTEDLDNLLHDDDDTDPREDVFRPADKESWTTQFIFSSEGGQGSRQKKNSTTRPRRNQPGRRSTSSRASPRGFAFAPDSLQRFGEGEPLNFGGAFAPPQQNTQSSFRRPVPATSRPPEYHQQHQQHQPNPSYAPTHILPTQHQHQYQQARSGMSPHGHHAFMPQNSHVYSSFNPQMQPNYSFGSQPSSGFAMQSQAFGAYDQRQNFVPATPHFAQPHQNWGAAAPYDREWQAAVRQPDWTDYGVGYNSARIMSPTPAFVPNPQYSAWNEQQQQQMQPQQMQNPYTMHAMSRGANSPTPSIDSYAGVGTIVPLQSPVNSEWHEPQAVHPSMKVAEKEDAEQQIQITQPQKEDTIDTKTIKKDREPESSQHKSPKKKGSTGSALLSSPKGGKKILGKKKDDDASLEDPAESKRAELVESPAMRAAFKDFYRKFRIKERLSFKDAEDFALSSLTDGVLPEKVQWRVYLELADLAKRSNRFDDARKLYRQVCELQPYASQGWLEYSKLEEEGGHLNRCSKILQSGLEYCALSENLLTRAIKHEEKMGNLHRARQLLARLKHVGIEKVWRTVLEGALLEARAGNHTMARRVLKYLMHHVPWYGPLYLESYRLEKDLGQTADALTIVERGLNAIPRYGPLWFGAFRLCEAIDVEKNDYKLTHTVAMFERAQSSISRELLWKVHLEAAQILERATVASVLADSAVNIEKELVACRKRYAVTALTCPANLCWKVWLAGGRMELVAGNSEIARKLFARAYDLVPDKGRLSALLECARLEEFDGNLDLARAILCKCRTEGPSDWKVWLESVLLEIRDCKYKRAIDFAKNALKLHSGTGRLWASLVQLRYADSGEDSQFHSLKRALRTVPKSGEVWCEGGRIHLNPFSRTFDLDEARRHFFFATRFTPQYGDSFIESFRLEVIERWILPIAASLWEAMHDHLSTELEAADPTVEEMVLLASRTLLVPKGKTEKDDVFAAKIASSVRSSLEKVSFEELFEDSDLELRCANADPNYGLLWFHCRYGPTETARTVLGRAREQIIRDVRSNAHLYIIAMVRRYGVMATLQKELDSKHGKLSGESGTGKVEWKATNWDSILQDRLRSTPSIDMILKPGEIDEKSCTVLLESSVTGSSFGTGIVALNIYKPLKELSLIERRKILFGSDALFS